MSIKVTDLGAVPVLVIAMVQLTAPPGWTACGVHVLATLMLLLVRTSPAEAGTIERNRKRTGKAPARSTRRNGRRKHGFMSYSPER